MINHCACVGPSSHIRYCSQSSMQRALLEAPCLVRSLFLLLLLPLIVSTSIEPYTSELARLNNSDLLLVEVLTETLNCFLDKQSLWGFLAMSRQMDEQLLAGVYNPSSLYTFVAESLLPQILWCLFFNSIEAFRTNPLMRFVSSSKCVSWRHP